LRRRTRSPADLPYVGVLIAVLPLVTCVPATSLALVEYLYR
jgi:TRAP-type C4-dicarboxylate transport system permease large subunit